MEFKKEKYIFDVSSLMKDRSAEFFKKNIDSFEEKDQKVVIHKKALDELSDCSERSWFARRQLSAILKKYEEKGILEIVGNAQFNQESSFELLSLLYFYRQKNAVSFICQPYKLALSALAYNKMLYVPGNKIEVCRLGGNPVDLEDFEKDNPFNQELLFKVG